MKFNNLLSLLLPALLLVQLPLTANNVQPVQQRQDYKKTFSETFSVNDGGKVRLENRYGEIKVETWERDEVKIDITVKVSANSQESADRMFDRIGVSFTGMGNSAAAVTNIGDGRKRGKSVLEKLLDGDYWGNGSSSSKGDFRIYYYVQMPRGADLEVAAKYCDVELPDLLGDTELSVGYGDLVAGDLGGSNELSTSYGSARVGRLGGESSFYIRYSEGTIEAAEELRYDGRYSETRIGPTKRLLIEAGYEELEVESAEELRLDGNYNEVDVEDVGRLFIDGNYNDFDIGSIKRELEVDAAYGDLEIDKLLAGFERVYIRVRYIDVEIDLDDRAGCELDLRTRYGGISYPDGVSNLRSHKDGNSRSIKGKLSGQGSGKIDISTSYGDIDID